MGAQSIRIQIVSDAPLNLQEASASDAQDGAPRLLGQIAGYKDSRKAVRNILRIWHRSETHNPIRGTIIVPRTFSVPRPRISITALAQIEASLAGEATLPTSNKGLASTVIPEPQTSTNSHRQVNPPNTLNQIASTPVLIDSVTCRHGGNLVPEPALQPVSTTEIVRPSVAPITVASPPDPPIISPGSQFDESPPVVGSPKAPGLPTQIA